MKTKTKLGTARALRGAVLRVLQRNPDAYLYRQFSKSGDEFILEPLAWQIDRVTAKAIIGEPGIVPGYDGLFPEQSQTWRAR